MVFAARRRSPLAALAAVCLVGCDGQASPTAPTSTPLPTAPVEAAAPATGTWVTERTVVAVTDLRVNPPSPPHAAVGDVRRDVQWLVRGQGDAIELHEDLSLAPWDHTIWTARLDGVRFEANFSNEDYLLWMPQFRGGTLRGTFSDDLSTFEAESTLSWGPPGADLTVTYRWRGSR
jgi:hypothetical protein